MTTTLCSTVHCWFRSCGNYFLVPLLSYIVLSVCSTMRSGAVLGGSLCTSRSLLRDLRDCHVHNLFNGLLLYSSTSPPLTISFQIWALTRQLESCTTSTISSLTRRTFLVDIRYIHAENLHNGFRNQKCELALVWNCLHLRLIVWTQSLKIIILVHIVQFLFRRTVIECASIALVCLCMRSIFTFLVQLSF